MFNLINGVLYYNNVVVHHEGETLKGSFIVLIFEDNYCYLTSLNTNINTIIEDYIECTNKQNFIVNIHTITF